MIKVVGHRGLVKVQKLEDADPRYKAAAAAGLVFADTEDSKRREVGLDRGTVISVGEDAFKQFYINCNGTLDGFQPWCKEGDTISFAKYAGKLIEDPETSERYIVLNDEDVVAVLGGM